MMPSGAAGKKYIEEITRLLKLWIQDSPLKSITLKAIHIMPAVLLHLVLLEGRLKLSEEGNISNLLHEGETIQERMKISEKDMSIGKVSLKLKKYDEQR